MSDFNKEYFTHMYDGGYDKRNPDYKFKKYIKTVLSKLKKKENISLLDIGCAYGSFINQAQHHVSDITGVDISEHAVEVATNRVPKATVFQSDIHDLPTDKKYDVITSYDVLEHVPNLPEAFEKLKSLLNPGGVIMISVPVYDTIVGKMVMKIDKDPTHIHKNSRYWWPQQIKANGFKVIKWGGIWRYYFKDKFYMHLHSSLTKSFTPAIYVIFTPEV